MSLVNKHEDERRILIEWIDNFPVKSCKIVVVKEPLELGNHYHKNKDEIFYLLSGNGTYELDGVKEEMKTGDKIFILRDTKHSFWLEAGSILLGAGTEPYDKDDEHTT